MLLLLATMLFACFSFETVLAKGFLEISLVNIRNSRMDRADGTCCNDKTRNPSGFCPPGAVCALYMRICVREFFNYSLTTGTQGYVGKCPYGSAITGHIGSGQFEKWTVGIRNYSFPIEFAWMTSFTVIIELYDRDPRQADSYLMDQRIKKEVLVPDSHWAKYETTSTSGPGSVTYEYLMRMRCAKHYYNVTCTKFCAPRNDYHGHYTCDKDGNKICHRGWMGDACNTAICKPGCRKGSCTVPNTCVCENGWLGALCEECIKYPGCKHGTCGKSPYTCSCFMNYGGALCDKDLNYCGRHRPCQNGGLCRNLEGNKQPYQCICRRGWTGPNCLLKHNPCKTGPYGQTSPCHNNATCLLRTDSYVFSADSISALTDTAVGTADETAVASSDDTSVLLALAKTPHKNRLRDYMCKCKDGWTGDHCDEDVNECLSRPCKNDGVCHNVKGLGYNCTCRAGYMGLNCHLSQELCAGSPCSKDHTESCELVHGSGARAEDYKCHCMPGWEGSDCTINRNECARNPCHNGGTCSDLVNDYVCSCTNGWTGRNCTDDVNECESSPCFNGAKCINGRNSYRCDCHGTGYRGERCEIDDNPCQPNPCRNGAYCYTITDDFLCRCTGEYEGKTCERRRPGGCGANCLRVDPCTVPVHHNNSAAGPARGALQRSGRGGASASYESSNICGKHGTCVSRGAGQFTCSCDKGWLGEACEKNINDCRNQPCLHGGTCIDGVDVYTCICPEGREGKNCEQDIDDCKTNPCRNGGRCQDRLNGYQCRCADGWQGRWCHLSTGESQPCDQLTCGNGGVCQPDPQAANGFSCRCQRDWTGDTCQDRVNDTCSLIQPCKNGATCVNVGETYACVCSDGFEGRDCERNVNECNPYPCFNGGNCIDRINHFVCQCPTGFAGPDCRVDIDECASNPCPYGATCIDGAGNYTCRCEAGSNCNRELFDKANGACIHQRRVHRHGEEWTSDCKTCRCKQGKVNCTQAFCGLYSCWQARHDPDDWFACKRGEVCYPLPEEKCLVPDCATRGVCRNATDATGIPHEWASDSGPTCKPNTDRGQLGNRCAKINLKFDLTLLPIGTTVNDVCREIRLLPKVERLKRFDHNLGLGIQCEMHLGDLRSTVEVAVSTTRFSGPLPNCVGKCWPATYQLAENIAWDISKHSWLRESQILEEWKARDPRGAFPILSAVIEIRINNLVESQDNRWSPYLIPVSCSIMGIIGILAMIMLVMYHNRQKQLIIDKYAPYQKANNFAEQSAGVQRVRNQLFDAPLQQQPPQQHQQFQMIVDDPKGFRPPLEDSSEMDINDAMLLQLQQQPLPPLPQGVGGAVLKHNHIGPGSGNMIPNRNRNALIAPQSAVTLFPTKSTIYHKTYNYDITTRNLNRQQSQGASSGISSNDGNAENVPRHQNVTEYDQDRGIVV